MEVILLGEMVGTISGTSFPGSNYDGCYPEYDTAELILFSENSEI